MYNISSGMLVSGISLNSDTMRVYAGVEADVASVNGGGLTVSRGDNADDITVSSGGRLSVSSDGILQDNTLSFTVTESNGDVLLANTMPQTEYMYGCCPTAVSMLLGYYDLYGYRGKDLSAIIDGDVVVDSRGTDGNKYNMNEFNTALGLAAATQNYVYRFVSHTDLDLIIQNYDAAVPTTPAEELEYSFVNGGEGPDIRTDDWNCLADYLGTGQYWRGNANLSTAYRNNTMLEEQLYNENMTTIAAGDVVRTVPSRLLDFLYGLNLYVQSKGYELDMKVTGTHQVDTWNGGDFTFDDYKKEIDAGRPVLVMINSHIMTGYGYNDGTQEIIFDDCYDADQRMTWGGTYHYAGQDRSLETIATVGFITTDADIDLAVMPASGTEDKLVLAVTEGQLVSTDYIFAGSPLYLSFGAANLGTSPSGEFDAVICIDGEQTELLPAVSVQAETLKSLWNIPIVTELGVGLHHIKVALDPDSRIQERAALNNSEERALMVLQEGTNVVQGMKVVSAGEVSGDDYVMNGAGLLVLSGGTAEWILVQGKVTSRSLDGKQISFVPGVVNPLQGGVVRGATVYEYGQLLVEGTAENVQLCENGFVSVYEGGVVSGLAMDAGASLLVESGAVLTGRVRLNEDAEAVRFADGATLDFNLSQTAPGGDVIVNGLSAIYGTPEYTITVNGTEASGLYKLADGANGFAGTVSIGTDGSNYGSLTVNGDALTHGIFTYTLTAEGDLLQLAVSTELAKEFYTGNFTGNGTARHDVVVYQKTEGGLVNLLANNGIGTFSPVELGAAGDPWQMIAVGDFNADGVSDVLWRNMSVGDVGSWLGDGMFGTEWQYMAGAAVGEWEIVGVGDFNNDATDDVLWYNTETGLMLNWQVQNGVYSADAIIAGAAPGEWRFTGVGDFNGDGTDDILWHNQISGAGGYWALQNGTYSAWCDLAGADPAEWTMIGIGDFDANGYDDVLWLNNDTGLVGCWANNSTGNVEWNTLAGAGDLDGWHYEGVGDFNSDGRADVLWAHDAGSIGAWITDNERIAVGSWMPIA